MRFFPAAVLVAWLAWGGAVQAASPASDSVNVYFAASVAGEQEAKAVFEEKTWIFAGIAKQAGIKTLATTHKGYTLSPAGDAFQFSGYVYFQFTPADRQDEFMRLLTEAGYRNEITLRCNG